MSDIVLPGSGVNYSLPLTLQLVKDLEHAGGSLFKIADMLMSKDLPLGDILKLLTVAYRAAGCTMDQAALDDFLLKTTPALTLTEILVGLLAPLHDLGVVHEET